MDELFRKIAEAYGLGAARSAPGASSPSSAPGAPHAPRAPNLPPLPSLFDLIRLQALIHEESLRIRDLVIERLIAPAVHAAAHAPAGSPPGSAKPDPRGAEIVDLLRRIQMTMLKHPIAAQAAFAALVAEGRRFAATPEGAEWREALASSELLTHTRRVWDAVSLNMLEDSPDTIIPSAYLEALLRAARSPELEELLRSLHHKTDGGRDGAAR